MFRNSIIVLLLSCLVFAGCVPSPVYQREEPIPQNAWSYDFKPDFKFDITDTTSLYNIFFLIRHTEAYRYSNIWMWVYTKRPGDSTFQKSRINIPLAEASGKWLGRGMGEIWEQRLPISLADPTMLRKKGTYEIKFEQNMRINPLPDILHIGLRIEKIRPRNFTAQ
jgi:gliding motility-associated lipoprotein GldH